MSTRNWIEFPRVEGETSRQAHADLPAGHLRARDRPRRILRSRDAHLSPPPADGLEHVRRARCARAPSMRCRRPVSARSPLEATLLLTNANLRIRASGRPNSRWRSWRATPTATAALRPRRRGRSLLRFRPSHLSRRRLHPVCRAGRCGGWNPRRTTVAAADRSDAMARIKLAGARDARAARALRSGGARHAEARRGVQTRNATANGSVQVKRRGALSTITYPFNPLDAVGWKGNLAPVRLNWRDIRPVMSHRYHIPPIVHSTFVADRFVVCTFVPRPIESDPGALKVPFFHSNDDFDEVIFYHQGEFFSRDNIQPGMVTFHPERLHARAASQGLCCRRTSGQDDDRRSGGDDRRARSARDGAKARRRPKTRATPTAGKPK